MKLSLSESDIGKFTFSCDFGYILLRMALFSAESYEPKFIYFSWSGYILLRMVLSDSYDSESFEERCSGLC